jgi:hypothetical protein
VSVRSVIAVLGATVLIYFLTGILEGPLVGTLASKRPTNMDELIVLRNEPAVVYGRIVITGFVSLLAGYIAAKIAGEHELAHAGAAALVQTAILFGGFSAEPPATALPYGMRTAFVTITIGAMLAGAAIRARASRLGRSTETGL